MPPSLIRTLRNFGVFIVTLLLVGMLGNAFFPFSPMDDRTDWFKRHYYLSGMYPFVIPYFLMLPDDYDPSEQYPLVLVLHGATKEPHGARYLAEDYLRENYPAIVLAPMAPFHRDWSTPDIKTPETKTRGGSIFDALGLAMEILREVEDNYAVDPDRIYITGSSMGGFGAFGAAYYYPDKFAAAVPVASGWAADDVTAMTRTPIWAWHDKRDPVIPVVLSRHIIREIRKYGGEARLSVTNGYGHGAWKGAYKKIELWDWMFNQSRPHSN